MSLMSSQQEVKILQDEVVRWLNGLLQPAAPLTTANFLDALSTGVLLCQLLRRLHASLAAAIKDKKVHEKAAAGSFFAHDNVQVFLNAVASVGVPAHGLFETNDLVGVNKNPRSPSSPLLESASANARGLRDAELSCIRC
jgi:hypothetical protein